MVPAHEMVEKKSAVEPAVAKSPHNQTALAVRALLGSGNAAARRAGPQTLTVFYARVLNPAGFPSFADSTSQGAPADVRDKRHIAYFPGLHNQ